MQRTVADNTVWPFCGMMFTLNKQRWDSLWHGLGINEGETSVA